MRELTTADWLNNPVVKFALQISAAEVPELAARFSYPQDDGPCLAAGRDAVGRGFYTLAELSLICHWKTQTGRTQHYVEQNSEEDAEFATGEALSVSDELERMEALCWLHGVEVPTASALLFFAFPDDYPIIDKRALETLGVVKTPRYTPKYWEEYLTFCRTTAEAIGVPIRTLDKALWQASKEGLG